MMEAYVEQIEDSKGDIVDILYYCAWHIPKGVLVWPGFDWPDYDVHCAVCEMLIHKGANDE